MILQATYQLVFAFNPTPTGHIRPIAGSHPSLPSCCVAEISCHVEAVFTVPYRGSYRVAL